MTKVSFLANPAPLGSRGDKTRESFGEDYLSPTRLVSKVRSDRVCRNLRGTMYLAATQWQDRPGAGDQPSDLCQHSVQQSWELWSVCSLFGVFTVKVVSRRECSKTCRAEVCGECSTMSERPGDWTGWTEGALAASLSAEGHRWTPQPLLSAGELLALLTD